MAYLKINQQKITLETGEALAALCPFSAIGYEAGRLEIGPGCRMCRLCVKQGPAGAVEWIEDDAPVLDKSGWRGIAVYAEYTGGALHPVAFELLGKAVELAGVTGHPVYALLIGDAGLSAARQLLAYGADRVYLYSHPALAGFTIEPYANVFADFIEKARPSSILVGATQLGRSLAPRVAARLKTGLTADCTRLEMKENTDLVQIRPAFGGNIMAQIVTAKTRPQFCTVRYKVFSTRQPQENPAGEVIPMQVTAEMLSSRAAVLSVRQKPRESDIADAEVLVAAGRGVKTQADLAMVEELAELLGGMTACTRPLIESGWMNPKRQIGLSGRTVAPKLLITVGVSGSVQFAAGMRGAQCIVAINSDPYAPIFDVAHYGLVGDLYTILPRLMGRIKEGNVDVPQT